MDQYCTVFMWSNKTFYFLKGVYFPTFASVVTLFLWFGVEFLQTNLEKPDEN